MFLTRSIRRKMVLGMALVVAMLLTLSFSGVSGLMSFRSVVQDLDRKINHTPRRDLLVDSLAALFEPLLLQTGESAPGDLQIEQERRLEQQRQFGELLAQAKGHLSEFRMKLEEWSAFDGRSIRKMAIEAQLHRIDQTLSQLQKLLPGLADAKSHAATHRLMFLRVASLQTTAQKILDPQDGLNATLSGAQPVYRSRLWLVSGSALVAIVLFFGLVACGYRWIFTPIRQLHQGTSRVAQGDFDFRLSIPSNDEMAELAESFNKMTARFQETAADLDRQVRERSRQLVRSERLAGIGFLAAGVAHEINNPLAAVAMAAESLESRITSLLEHCEESERAVIPQYLAMIQREAFRCQQITARLLDFSRGQDATRSQHDLTAIINEVLTLVRHMSKYRSHEISFSYAASTMLEVNGPEVRQVVLNLVANALESMEEGGHLEISVTERMDEVVVTFVDSGCGMTPDTIENLFEPFFTRRKSGKGTGLGLSISHRIINDHGGRIEARSDGPGQGSTFVIHLPRKAAGTNTVAA